MVNCAFGNHHFDIAGWNHVLFGSSKHVIIVHGSVVRRRILSNVDRYHIEAHYGDVSTLLQFSHSKLGSADGLHCG